VDRRTDLGGLIVQPFRKTIAIRHLTRRAKIAFLVIGLVLPASPFCASTARAEPPRNAHKASSLSALSLSAFVAEAAQRFQVPVEWIRAVMRVESGGQVRAVSPKGAMGLMQIMPKTYAGLRIRYRLGANPYDPHDNILAGAAYLREMHDRYGAPGFLAAYNAGPARYDEHLATGRPLPIETQAYVATLMPMIDGKWADDKSATSFDLVAWLRSALFPNHENARPSDNKMPFNALPNHRPNDVRVVDLTALTPRSNGLFVRLAEQTQRQ
jgi:hypothetical protein